MPHLGHHKDTLMSARQGVAEFLVEIAAAGLAWAEAALVEHSLWLPLQRVATLDHDDPAGLLRSCMRRLLLLLLAAAQATAACPPAAAGVLTAAQDVLALLGPAVRCV